MANKRLSKEKQALVFAALCEGAPIEAVARMFRIGTNTITRVIRETGEAFADYMDANFRDLPCVRIEMDEQWQYVGAHGSRLIKPENDRGDFWLWCCIDADTKLVFSHRVGKRDWWTGNTFVADVRNRVRLPVQIATDNHRPYAFHIRQHFGYEGYSYGTETKVFGESKLSDGTLARLGRNEGVRRMQTAERAAVVRLAGLRKPYHEPRRARIPDCAAGVEAISAQGIGLQQKLGNAQAGDRDVSWRL